MVDSRSADKAVAANDYSDIALFRRVLGLARPYRIQVIAIFLLGLLATPLALLAPLPLAITVDSVLGDQPLPPFLESLLPSAITESDAALLLFATALVIAVVLLQELEVTSSLLLRTYTTEKLTLHFRSLLFRHGQRLSLSYHDVKGTTDSTYRIQYDSLSVSYLAIDGITPFVKETITLGAMIYVIFQLDPQLALVALAISPILFGIARLYRKQLRKQSKQVKRRESEALSVVQEVLTSLRVVKAFGQEQREHDRFMDQSDQSLRARMRYTAAEGGASLLLGVTIAVGTALVLYIGARHVQAGIITLGALLLIMGYLGQLYGPLKMISRRVTKMPRRLASAERAFKLLDAAPDVPEKPDAEAIERARGVVAFKDVSFSYGGELPILRDVSFTVPQGDRVGIAGETGVGKSTFVSLLTRFYDPVSGSILLDGKDLRDYVLADLRKQFAIVLQETVLFSTTIAENIAYARPEASEEEIIDAAKAANAHDFIADLPDGYSTQVGERGMMLSGGERQRIALARAFLKDAPILILDEPTSSVDVKTEKGIMEAMERLMHDRTTFLIAHRLSTLENCDALLLIEDGKVKPVLFSIESKLKRSLGPAGRQNGAEMVLRALMEDEEQDGDGQKRAGRPLEIEWQESVEELEALYFQETNGQRRVRLRALLLLQQGNSLKEVSESESISYRTLKRWVAWYRTGGLDELLRRTPGSGAVMSVSREGD